jgi:hypothetical protein
LSTVDPSVWRAFVAVGPTGGGSFLVTFVAALTIRSTVVGL